jgi:hypothetical protein
MTGDSDGGEPAVDPLLGQPRMVADPRISLGQGAAVLGKTVVQVRRLITLGRLPRHGPANNFRPLLPSEVEALHAKGEPISLKEAARKLSRSLAATRELVADGHLSLVPGTKSLVYPADVAVLARAPSQRSIRRPAGPPGYLDTKQAGHHLGLTGPYVSQLAAEEKLPAIFQDGQWWFDPDQIELVRRARRARRDRAVHRRPMQRRGSTPL